MRYNSISVECQYACDNRMDFYTNEDIRALHDAGFTNGAIERIVNFSRLDGKEKIEHKIPASRIARVVTGHVFGQINLRQLRARKAWLKFRKALQEQKRIAKNAG